MIYSALHTSLLRDDSLSLRPAPRREIEKQMIGLTILIRRVGIKSYYYLLLERGLKRERSGHLRKVYGHYKIFST